MLEHLQYSDMTLMFEYFIVQMESEKWVFILCLNSVSGKPINVKHNQPNEPLSTQFASNECCGVGLFQRYWRCEGATCGGSFERVPYRLFICWWT